MLDSLRGKYITASNAHKIMGFWEQELNQKELKKPEISGADNAISYCKRFYKKNWRMPLVKEARANGITVTGEELKECYDYYRLKSKYYFTVGMEQYAMELAYNHILKCSNPLDLGGSFRSSSMERGARLEAEAIMALERKVDITFSNIGENQSFLYNDALFLGVTPDGIESEGFEIKSLAEVKAPDKYTHGKYLYKIRTQDDLLKIESKYYWQIQAGLLASGAPLYHFASYFRADNPKFRLMYLKVHPNKEHQDLIIKRAAKVRERMGEITREIQGRL